MTEEVKSESEKKKVLSIYSADVHNFPLMESSDPISRYYGFKVGDFPVAERYYNQALSLPMFQALTIEAQNKVIEALHTVAGMAKKIPENEKRELEALINRWIK